MQNLESRFAEGVPFAQFLEQAVEHRELWHGMARRASVPDDVRTRVEQIPGRWHLLVLLEDWCGDAINTIPYLAALADAVPNVELRVLGRDANPDLMDAHLTGTSRSIPVVMVLDERFREHGWWGSRPAELQRWVVSEGLALPADERYRQIRTWYARDRGRTTLEEVVGLIERYAAEMAGAALTR